jgi:oxygen-independent coproporphyrinogen-3 oxidase
MAGIYIHIPFCKKACHYCDFHFSTNTALKAEMVNAIVKEIELQKDYAQNESIETIYFGGGTPSLLEQEELFQLLNTIAKYHSIIPNPEITLEANPDDIYANKLYQWRQAGINRLSIGIQSFFQEHLQWMNRAHSSIQAFNAVTQSQDAGFKNITIDLIYGFPGLSDEQWKKNLENALKLDVKHISPYCLTIEEKTALHHFVKKGLLAPPSEEQGAKQFEYMTRYLIQNGFEHYEISNFAKPGFYSKHNSNYWKGKSYIGIGPSAHSFNGFSRQWNIRNNAEYIRRINASTDWFEKEQLSIETRYNEYVMTSLRTHWGCDLKIIKNQFGDNLYFYILQQAKPFIQTEKLLYNQETLKLSSSGKLFADKIASDLFWV